MNVFPAIYVPLEGGTVTEDQFKQGVRALHDDESSPLVERQVGFRTAHVIYRDGDATMLLRIARSHSGQVSIDHPECDDDATYDRLWSRLYAAFHG